MQTSWLVHAIAQSIVEAVLSMTATRHRKQWLRTSEAMFGGTASQNGGKHREGCSRTSEAFSRPESGSSARMATSQPRHCFPKRRQSSAAQLPNIGSVFPTNFGGHSSGTPRLTGDRLDHSTAMFPAIRPTGLRISETTCQALHLRI